MDVEEVMTRWVEEAMHLEEEVTRWVEEAMVVANLEEGLPAPQKHMLN